MSKHYGAEDHTRDIKDEYGDHHTTGYDQLLPTKAEQEARRAAYNVHRFATGIASTSERIRAYGYDLRQAENIARAYEAIYEQLDDAAKGR